MSGAPNFKLEYTLPSASESAEWKRLDEMHIGMAAYFEDELSLAPIRDPKRILELGAGSGAWAIQAAQKYPDAEVTAADLAPLPPRTLPSNLKFQQLNVNDEFPFRDASFDVVHMRFILCHLPNHASVIRRTLALVKPGGWLLIEDFDNKLQGDELPERFASFKSEFNEYFRAQGCDMQIGPQLEGLLRGTGLCSEVNVAMIPMPYSPLALERSEPKMEFMGNALKRSSLRAYKAMGQKVPLINDELLRDYEEELSQPGKAYYFPIYAAAAQRQ